MRNSGKKKVSRFGFLSLLLVVSMFALTGCGDKKTGKPEDTANPPAAEQDVDAQKDQKEQDQPEVQDDQETAPAQDGGEVEVDEQSGDDIPNYEFEFEE